jgi:hypothetical protein
MAELEREEAKYACVAFSPWQYEDVADVKTALMNAVLAKCHELAPDEKTKTRIERLRERVPRFGRRAATFAATTAPALVPAALAMADPGLGIEAAAAGQAVVKAGADVAVEALKEKPESGKTGSRSPESVDDLEIFRAELEAILKVLPIEAVVVFVDDLDRCLPPTIIATFEALRLFLHTPKTAHVVAVSREIVEAAIDSRYPEVRREVGAGSGSTMRTGPASPGIGHEYLEKMLQLQIRVPELSRVDIETYVNLLLTQRQLKKKPFLELVGALRASRRNIAFPPPYNAGVAADLLRDTFTTDLANDLAWGSGICEVAASGLRGNPRQLKRFLNDLTWRMRAASRRGIELQPNVLAKLMILDEQFPADFQQLFDWQQMSGGASRELKLAEDIANGLVPADPPELEQEPGQRRVTVPANKTGTGKGAQGAATSPAKKAASGRTAARTSDGRAQTAPKEPDGDTGGLEGDDGSSSPPESESALTAAANQWAGRHRLASWLRLDPPLGEVDLRIYFSYFRDRIVIGSVASTLDLTLQTLISRIVQEENARMRRAAIDEAVALSGEKRQGVLNAVLEVATRSPDSNAFRAAAELGGRQIDLGAAVCEAFRLIPHQSLAPGRIVGALAQLKDAEGWDELVAAWAASPVKAVAAMANMASGAR